MDAGLTGHVHLNKVGAFFSIVCFLFMMVFHMSNCSCFVQDLLEKFNITMQDVYEKCQEVINSFRKKKQGGNLFKRITLSVRLVLYV